MRRLPQTLILTGLCLAPALAHERVYEAELSGAAMAPPVKTSGAGHVHVHVDLDLVTIQIEATFAGLTGAVTRARIHGLTDEPQQGTAGVVIMQPSLPGFPTGQNAGSYHHVLSLGIPENYAPEFIVAHGGTTIGALNALLEGLQESRVYFQIDTAAFPNGEIRGFLERQGLPGDMNCDEVISVGDIAGFVLALTDPGEYAVQFPACDIHNADLNNDDGITVGDIALFVEVLLN